MPLQAHRRAFFAVSVALLAAVLAAAGARAQTCSPYVRSWSQVCGGGLCVEGSIPLFGHPAVTSRSAGFFVPDGYNLGATAAMAIDNGGFDARAYGGGYTEITLTSNGLGGKTSGIISDCGTVSGGSGSGYVHLPIHVTGSTSMGWTIVGTYQVTAGNEPAGSSFDLLCGVAPLGSSTSIPCDASHFAWLVGESIDEELELVFAFTFGQPFSFLIQPALNAGIGYAANGGEGLLQGFAQLSLVGSLGPVSFTDLSGTPLPGASMTSASGYDYGNPVPEPAAAACAASALGALAGLARQRCPRIFLRNSRITGRRSSHGAALQR